MPRARDRLRLLRPPRRIPEHPYRDSVLAYGFIDGLYKEGDRR